MKNDNKTISIKISLVLLTVLFIAGCAGPKMETRPTKPVIEEVTAKQYPDQIRLTHEYYPGEVIKRDSYAEGTVIFGKESKTFYQSGYARMWAKSVSPTKDITFELSGEIVTGEIGKRINKEKIPNCTGTMSEQGRFSMNCPEMPRMGNLTQAFPQRPVSIGEEWSDCNKIDVENLGAIQMCSKSRLNSFSLINNRLCAKVEFDGKMTTLFNEGIEKGLSKEEKMGLRIMNQILMDSKMKGFYFYDIDLREIIYSGGTWSFAGLISSGKNKVPLTMDLEFILKLDHRESIFLRPQVIPPQVGVSFVTVIGTSANIRSKAGNEFTIITTVKQGDKLTLLGEYGDWFNVRLENGQEGWIHRRFVK